MNLEKWAGILKGQKTYVAAVLAAITAVGGYLIGDVSGSTVMDVVVNAVLAFFLLRGMVRETNATVDKILKEVTNPVRTVHVVNSVSVPATKTDA